MSYDIEWWKSKEQYHSEEYHDMKWWARMEDEGQCIDSDLNITSNLRDMFSWALGVDYWVDAVEWKTGQEIVPILTAGVQKMISNKEEAEKYNSPNGWGIYPHALEFLTKLLGEATTHKNLYLRIDR